MGAGARSFKHDRGTAQFDKRNTVNGVLGGGGYGYARDSLRISTLAGHMVSHGGQDTEGSRVERSSGVISKPSREGTSSVGGTTARRTGFYGRQIYDIVKVRTTPENAYDHHEGIELVHDRKQHGSLDPELDMAFETKAAGELHGGPKCNTPARSPERVTA